MQIFTSLNDLPASAVPSIVTVGNFDGVHCGHRMVISNVIARAKASNARSAVVTFDPHPAHILHNGPKLSLITPTPAKLDLLAETGIDLALVLPFDDTLRNWSALDFAQRVLADGLHATEVHEGETFRFGHNAQAGIHDLEAFGQDLGFTVRAHDPLIRRGAPISSSRIRTLVAAGALNQARALLGRPFSIRSTPASGRGYGTRYAVPTINLAAYDALLPPYGVYITTLKIGSGSDAKTFRGVTNAGNRPTFGTDSFAVETHLLNFELIDLSEETPLELTFLRHLRAEQRFPSPEALRAQIMTDVRRAQRYFVLADTFSPTDSAAAPI